MTSSDCIEHFGEDIEDLLDRIGESGVIRRHDAQQRLGGLSEHIYRWNKVVNLVSRKDVNRLVSYHFCELVRCTYSSRHRFYNLTIGEKDYQI